jgi:hypothetical protein
LVDYVKIVRQTNNKETTALYWTAGAKVHHRSDVAFLDKSYELYRDQCLEIWGIRYQDIEVQIDKSYNPLRLPRIEADKSGGSKQGL